MDMGNPDDGQQQQIISLSVCHLGTDLILEFVFQFQFYIKRIHILCLQNGVFSPRQKLCRKNLTSSEHWEQQESTVSPRDRIGLPRNMNVRENSWAKWKQENRKNKETGLFRNICGGGCNRNRVNQKKGKSSPVMAEVAWNSCHVIRSLSHGSIRCSLAQGVLSQHQKLAVLAKGFTSIGSIKITKWTGSDHSRLSRVLLRV